MGDIPRVIEICNAIRFAGFPIDLGIGEKPLLKPDDAEHTTQCQNLLQGAYTTRQGEWIWTTPLINTVEDYVRKHGIKAKMVGPEFEDGVGLYPVSNERGEIYLGLIAPVENNAEKLQYMLKHESGHIRDQNVIIARFDPKIKTLMDKTKPTKEENLKLITGYLKIIEAKLPKKERKEFEQLSHRLFGDFKSYDNDSLSQIVPRLAEALRYGEEQFDPSMEKMTFENAFLYFQKGSEKGEGNSLFGIRKPNGEWLDLQRPMVAAYKQEAGIWDKITARPDYDPEIIKNLNPDPIRFFRMAIHACGRYFFPGIVSPTSAHISP